MTKLVKPRRKKTPLFFVATCGAGLEDLVAAEIKEHGGNNIAAKPGAVSWEGKLESGYRLCLWSRFTSRVLLEIARFDAPDTDTLYRQAGKIDWGAHFGRRTTFAIFSTVTDSPITHSKFAALRVKDAIVDQFRARTGQRPDVDTNRPGLRLNLHLQGPEAILAVDLSGDSLHRRGYRLAGVEAPLKETLAAGIVYLSGFTDDFTSDAVLLDPMCGSGTLLIEAAMIYGQTAPGLQRSTFGFMFWKRHDERLWEKLVNEATEREDSHLQKPWPRIIGYDADPRAVTAARKNIRAAGYEDRIEINQGQLAGLKRPGETGMVLVNPPYGERLSDREEVKYLYRCIGRIFSRELFGWQIGFFSGNPDLSDSVSQDWQKSFRLFNGPIKCRLHRGTIQPAITPPPSRPKLTVPEAAGKDDEFTNRLIKNYKTLAPWAEKEDILCFRLYDQDLPQYNISIDLYDDWAYVREYPSPATIDRETARNRFNAALHALRGLFAIPPSRIFFNKQDKKAPKNSAKHSRPKEKTAEVTEQQCRFLVNCTMHPESDLPLLERSVRLLTGELAGGKTFLNLFGGSGAATVHAMFNNALATTTVEPLTPLAQRARANFSLNGFGGPQHQCIQEDCCKWLATNRSRYGLILVNQPGRTGGGHRKTSYNARDDHEDLIRQAMTRLSRDGLLLFTVSQPQFELAEALAEQFIISDITKQIMPPDFTKSRRPLHCWEFRHPQQENKE